jgi:hypothetical protein
MTFLPLRILYYRFVRNCFLEIIENEEVQSKYALRSKTGDLSVPNPRMSFLGVLYLYVAIPKEIEEKKLVNDYLGENLKFLNDVFIAMGLYSLIRQESRTFRKGEQKIYLIKYVPILKIWDYIFLILLPFALYFLSLRIYF